MSSIDFTTPKDVVMQYFGPISHDDLFDSQDKILSSQDDKEFSDRTCDTKLFPYEAQGPFETPLPTLAEIDARITAAPADDEESTNASIGAVRMGPYMVKFGSSITIFQEAENLLYLERNSSVRTPKLYAAFMSQDFGPYDLSEDELSEDDLSALTISETTSPGNEEKPMCYYIIMEYIDGCTLYSIREKIRGGLQRKAAKLVVDQIQRLRSVPAENPELFGRIGGRSIFSLPNFDYPPAPDFNDHGPWDYETFVDRIEHTSKIGVAIEGFSNGHEEFSSLRKMLFSKMKTVLFDDLEPSERLPVLSHLDLKFENIMVKPARDKKGEIDDIEEVILIDWESMCWMPAWYEAATFRRLEVSPNQLNRYLGSAGMEGIGYVSIIPILYFNYCVEKFLFSEV